MTNTLLDAPTLSQSALIAKATQGLTPDHPVADSNSEEARLPPKIDRQNTRQVQQNPYLEPNHQSTRALARRSQAAGVKNADNVYHDEGHSSAEVNFFD